MTEKEKMLKGNLYNADTKELINLHKKSKIFMDIYNDINTTEKERKCLLERQLLSCGKNITITPPFRVDYGCFISIGDNFYANFDCMILDVCPVTIGNNVMFGPRVSVYTPSHPIPYEIRNTQLELGKPIVIGDNCWIGGNTVINPGVTIGSGSVIGSGSIVTKDIPSNVIAVGNPCKVLRKINDSDKDYWKEQQEFYFNN